VPRGTLALAPPDSLWRSTVRLMAARWRIAYNSFARGARWRQLTYLLVAGALVFLGLMAMGVSYIMTRGVIEFTGNPRLAETIAATILNGGLMLCIVVSFTVALAALYLSRDLDMLLVAPVERRAVFFSKLLGGLLPTNMLVLVITAVPLIGFGLAMRAYPQAGPYGAPFVGAALIALLILPLIPMSVGSITVMIIVRRVSAQRLGEVVGLIVVAMTLSIALVAGSARQLQQALTVRDLLGILQHLRSPLSPAEWLTNAIAAAGREDWPAAGQWFLITLGLSALGVGLMFVLSDRLYYEGWLHMQSADRQGRGGGKLPWTRTDRAETLGAPSGLMRWLPAPTVAVMRKDMRTIPRDLTNMAQVLSPLAIGVFFVLQQLLYPIRIGGTDRPQPFVAPLLAMLSAAIATGVSAMITARFGLTAFSAEGKNYWQLKDSPISRRQLLAGKYLVAYLPYLLLGTGLVLLLEAARAVSDARLAHAAFVPALMAAFRPGLLLYAFFVVALVGAGTLAITLALGAARPNMNWDTPHEMLTPDVGCLSLVLYGLYIVVAGTAVGLPAAVSGFGMLDHVGVLWAVGLAIGLSLTVVVVGGSLWLAAGELDAVGED
jgi:hypothetical protein